MLSPLKPLLCRHDFYWSERHGSDRCRRCGKRQAAEALDIAPDGPSIGDGGQVPQLAAGPLTLDALPGFRPAAGVFIDFEEPRSRPLRAPATVRPGARALKAEARARRERLPGLLDRLVAGARPSQEEAIDAILAVIEDAHSAEPVLFGPEAAEQFARLHRARLVLDG